MTQADRCPAVRVTAQDPARARLRGNPQVLHLGTSLMRCGRLLIVLGPFVLQNLYVQECRFGTQDKVGTFFSLLFCFPVGPGLLPGGLLCSISRSGLSLSAGDRVKT